MNTKENMHKLERRLSKSQLPGFASIATGVRTLIPFLTAASLLILLSGCMTSEQAGVATVTAYQAQNPDLAQKGGFQTEKGISIDSSTAMKGAFLAELLPVGRCSAVAVETINLNPDSAVVIVFTVAHCKYSGTEAPSYKLQIPGGETVSASLIEDVLFSTNQDLMAQAFVVPGEFAQQLRPISIDQSASSDVKPGVRVIVVGTASTTGDISANQTAVIGSAIVQTMPDTTMTKEGPVHDAVTAKLETGFSAPSTSGAPVNCDTNLCGVIIGVSQLESPLTVILFASLPSDTTIAIDRLEQEAFAYAASSKKITFHPERITITRGNTPSRFLQPPSLVPLPPAFTNYFNGGRKVSGTIHLGDVAIPLDSFNCIEGQPIDPNSWEVLTEEGNTGMAVTVERTSEIGKPKIVPAHTTKVFECDNTGGAEGWGTIEAGEYLAGHKGTDVFMKPPGYPYWMRVVEGR